MGPLRAADSGGVQVQRWGGGGWSWGSTSETLEFLPSKNKKQTTEKKKKKRKENRPIIQNLKSNLVSFYYPKRGVAIVQVEYFGQLYELMKINN